ncbi:MAG TPA: PAS domain-containing protein, partial [Streptosporangiaceae bacterium]
TSKEAGGPGMSDTTINYREVFRTTPGAMALLTPDGVILDVNYEYEEVSGRSREQLLGRNLFDAFPRNPDDPSEMGPIQLKASFDVVLETGERDIIMPVRYDVEDPGRPGNFEERYWAVVNTPLYDQDGRLVIITHRAEEVTHIVNQGRILRADQG